MQRNECHKKNGTRILNSRPPSVTQQRQHDQQQQKGNPSISINKKKEKFRRIVYFGVFAMMNGPNSEGMENRPTNIFGLMVSFELRGQMNKLIC